ncbi:MAG: right-handed parallel beta-helix repeat-containing protein [Pirellulales bacterium]|nr:right-handed parallel beta-helix repeat-containing protein [Pirellulales bacterium]
MTTLLRSALVLLLLSVQNVAAKEYYINSSTGSDANDGSISSPWRTTGHAFAIIRAGDVLNFFEGHYPAMNEIPGGTLKDPVIIRGITGERVLVSDSSVNNGLVIANSHVVVEGFEISHMKNNGVNIQADHVTLRNCIIHHTGTGIKCNLPAKNHHILIERCTFYWFKSMAIFMDEVEKFIVRNCLFQESASVTMDPGGAVDLLIENNLVDQNNRSLGGLKLRWGNVELVDEPNNNGAIVRHNILMEGEKYNLLLASANGAMVYNNVLVSNVNRGFLSKGLLYTQLDPSASRGHPMGPNKNNVVKNNIFLVNGPDHPQGSRHQVLFDVDTNMRKDLTTWTIDHNLYYKSKGSEYVRNGARMVMSNNVPGWGTNFDRNSIVGKDPLFSPLDPVESPQEYAPKEGSPAIDAGTTLTKTVGSGESNVVKVVDSRYFFGGYGLIPGDTVQIGENTMTVTDRDLENDTITVDRVVAWTANQEVSLPFKGIAPDLGVYEKGAHRQIADAFGAARFYAFAKGVRLPNKPVNLVVKPQGQESIELRWDDKANDENGFKIQRSPTGYSEWVDVGRVGANEERFVDTTVRGRLTYHYRVKAMNDAGLSAATAIQSVAAAHHSKAQQPLRQ